MAAVNLSTLAIALGVLITLFNVWALLRPEQFTNWARQFPRHVPTGVALMLLATAWFIYNVSQESLADFTAMKRLFYLLFAVVGLGSCLLLRDYLAVRGAAVVALLLAKLMVDSARWVETDWRLVIVTWAYVLAVAGMWFTISPWRLRNLMAAATATPVRTRTLSAARLAFGLLVLVLGLTVYRTAEARPVAGWPGAPLAAACNRA